MCTGKFQFRKPGAVEQNQRTEKFGRPPPVFFRTSILPYDQQGAQETSKRETAEIQGDFCFEGTCPAPSQSLPTVRAVECAVSNAADPRSKLPVRSSAWSAVPVAGLLFRATPRHMQCASGRRRLLRTPLGAHHSIMARWRASWAFQAQRCVCAGAACVRHASAPHSLRNRTPRAVAFGYVWRATLEYM